MPKDLYQLIVQIDNLFSKKWNTKFLIDSRSQDCAERGIKIFDTKMWRCWCEWSLALSFFQQFVFEWGPHCVEWPKMYHINYKIPIFPAIWWMYEGISNINAHTYLTNTRLILFSYYPEWSCKFDNWTRILVAYPFLNHDIPAGRTLQLLTSYTQTWFMWFLLFYNPFKFIYVDYELNKFNVSFKLSLWHFLVLGLAREEV